MGVSSGMNWLNAGTNTLQSCVLLHSAIRNYSSLMVEYVRAPKLELRV